MSEKIPNLLKSLFKEYGTKIEFTKNKTIFSESGEANSAYFLMKGVPSLNYERGKELTTRLLGHGDWFWVSIYSHLFKLSPSQQRPLKHQPF